MTSQPLCGRDDIFSWLRMFSGVNWLEEYYRHGAISLEYCSVDPVTCLDTPDAKFVFSDPNLPFSILGTQKYWSAWSPELPGMFGLIDKLPQEVKKG